MINDSFTNKYLNKITKKWKKLKLLKYHISNTRKYFIMMGIIDEYGSFQLNFQTSVQGTCDNF